MKEHFAYNRETFSERKEFKNFHSVKQKEGNCYEMIAKTFAGLENVLAQELNEIGAKEIGIGQRMVAFKGGKTILYRANLELHTAIRILKPIIKFKAKSADEVYKYVKTYDWGTLISPSDTFVVDATVHSEDFRHSKFVSYKVKDAIVDRFLSDTGLRPSISITNPTLRLNIHISGDECTLSLDSSGESLHRRGYRQRTIDAPINEVLAAGIIRLSGWRGETDFIDPMCGSGTFLIEAALIARNMSAGLFRKQYAFEKWPDFDKELFYNLYNDDSKERPFKHHIYGYDIDPKAVNAAKENVKMAGLSQLISVELRDFKDFTQPEHKAILMTNPPYGARMNVQNLGATYKMIGEKLKHHFVGNDAWIISNSEELFERIGLRPSIKVPLYNGSIECELRKYRIFNGNLKDFRSKGGQVKSEKERKEMAQRHFKKDREFKNIKRFDTKRNVI